MHRKGVRIVPRLPRGDFSGGAIDQKLLGTMNRGANEARFRLNTTHSRSRSSAREAFETGEELIFIDESDYAKVFSFISVLVDEHHCGDTAYLID